MSYSTRNSFYLRISKNIVLPIYVYLDERHVHWMNDKVLQHVLSDLRPRILPKLKAEAGNLTGGPSTAQKNTTVDTYRGDSYQFCYFIRKTEPHSVVIKTRNFRAAPKRSTSSSSHTTPTTLSSKRRGKRKELPSAEVRSKKRRKNVRLLVEEGDDAMRGDHSTSEDDTAGTADLNVPPIELEIEEEEEKPKPILGLTYQGFSIYGQCLCVVVEPWPVIRSTTVAPIFAQATVRAQTPLFLPEDTEGTDVHAETAPRSNVNQVYLNQVLKDLEVSDEEEDVGGMLEFSQVLHNVGDSRAGAINDDEDMDGSILFGDADEFREL